MFTGPGKSQNVLLTKPAWNPSQSPSVPRSDAGPRHLRCLGVRRPPSFSKCQTCQNLVKKSISKHLQKHVSLKVCSKHLGNLGSTPLKTPPGLLAVAVAASTFGSTFGSGSAVTGASSTKGRAVLRNMSAVLDAMTLAQPDQVERLGWGNDAKTGNWTAWEEQLWNVLQVKLGVVTKCDQIQYII